jgi:hypothetical protein
LLTAATLLAATGTEQKYTLIWDREKLVRSVSNWFTGLAKHYGLPRL